MDKIFLLLWFVGVSFITVMFFLSIFNQNFVIQFIELKNSFQGVETKITPQTILMWRVIGVIGTIAGVAMFMSGLNMANGILF